MSPTYFLRRVYWNHRRNRILKNNFFSSASFFSDQSKNDPPHKSFFNIHIKMGGKVVHKVEKRENTHANYRYILHLGSFNFSVERKRHLQ